MVTAMVVTVVRAMVAAMATTVAAMATTAVAMAFPTVVATAATTAVEATTGAAVSATTARALVSALVPAEAMASGEAITITAVTAVTAVTSGAVVITITKATAEKTRLLGRMWQLGESKLPPCARLMGVKQSQGGSFVLTVFREPDPQTALDKLHWAVTALVVAVKKNRVANHAVGTSYCGRKRVDGCSV